MGRIGRPITKIGDFYARWEVVAPAPPSPKGKRNWECKCLCGTIRDIPEKNLRGGESRSCGCLRIDSAKTTHIAHGLSASKAYRVWIGMRVRCSNKQYAGYKHYGGRGIAVCGRWGSFDAFYRDMGDPPTPKHSLDRIDNDGNYEPENCRWATRIQQARHTTRTAYLTYKNETKSAAEWAERFNMAYETLSYRLRAWGTQDMARVLETPVNYRLTPLPD